LVLYLFFRPVGLGSGENKGHARVLKLNKGHASVSQHIWRFRVVYRRVLGLGLIMVYLYDDFALQGRRFRVVGEC
jgi:hypothetical protein